MIVDIVIIGYKYLIGYNDHDYCSDIEYIELHSVNVRAGVA